MNIIDATASYERWLGRQIRLLPEDLRAKHKAMAGGPFPFLRATYYRWAQVWGHACGELNQAPAVLAVGDLHVENFGTWRDGEGRLAWGINDFDEAVQLPFTSDLVRLATSALLAASRQELHLSGRQASEAILDGYRQMIEAGGKPFVLASDHPALRAMAVERLVDPGKYWRKLADLPTWKGNLPGSAVKALERGMPERGLRWRCVHRQAGLGSLGRERYAALVQWHGGWIAREVKALASSGQAWAAGEPGRLMYRKVMDRAVRCPDPFARVRGRWIARRLGPDGSRIELTDLPRERDEVQLLHDMGRETANVHLGTARARSLRDGLGRLPKRWLHRAATEMARRVDEDWREWKRHGSWKK